MFDDENSVISNLQIRQLWPLSVPLSPPRDTPVAGRPLTNLTFAVNYAIAGVDARGMRVGNLFIHLLAALTLFGVVRRTLALPKLAGRFGPQSANLAFACALLWTVHPLQTEAVDYLSARSESLMGLMYLLVLSCSVRAYDAENANGVRPHYRSRNDSRPHYESVSRRWQVAGVLACAAGMAAKETMVTAPVILVLFDRLFLFESWGEMYRRRRAFHAGLIATWAVLAALMMSNPRTSAGFGSTAKYGTVDSPFVYFLNQLPIVTHYLRLVVWPVDGLVLDYGLPRPLMVQDVWMHGACLVALGLLALAALWYRPMIGALGAAFFILLGPTSSFVPVATEVGAERRMYLPLAPLIVLAVIAVFEAALYVRRRESTAPPVTPPPPSRRKRAPVPTGRSTPPTRPAYAGMIALACVSALLIAVTVMRNREYESRLSMARTVVARWPSGRGHFLLASELIQAGDSGRAMAQLQESARDYLPAHYALGTELAAQGRLQEADEHLRTYIRNAPQDGSTAAALDLLGQSLASRGQLDAAADQYKEILAFSPAHARALGTIAEIRLQQGRFSEAATYYQTLLQYQPTNGDLLSRLGLALWQAGRVNEAIPILERGVGAAPSNAPLRDMLGRALASQGRYAEAIVHFRRLTELQPADAAARRNLAAAERFAADARAASRK